MSLYVGAVSPQSLRVTVTRGQSDVDLTTATGFKLSVVKADGSTAEWTGTIVSSTTTTLVGKYTLQNGDISVAGTYHFLPRVLIGGGQVDGVEFSETVKPWPPA